MTATGYQEVGTGKCERPPLEQYARATETIGEFTYEPAVEFRDGDDFAALLAGLRAEIRYVAAAIEGGHSMDRARSIAVGIAAAWPDRAYFVEVWQEGQQGFAQIFQPYGVPRNR